MRGEQLTLFDMEPESPSWSPWHGLPSDWDPVETAEDLALRLHEQSLTGTQRLIAIFGLMLTDLLIRKNLRYGNSATDPVAVFARGLTPEERMAVRMDDKVNRIVRGQGLSDDGEDPYVDLAGYLLLSIVARTEAA